MYISGKGASLWLFTLSVLSYFFALKQFLLCDDKICKFTGCDHD